MPRRPVDEKREIYMYERIMYIISINNIIIRNHLLSPIIIFLIRDKYLLNVLLVNSYTYLRRNFTIIMIIAFN